VKRGKDEKDSDDLASSHMVALVPALLAQAAPSGQASTASSNDNQGSIDQSVALLRQDLRSGKKQTIAASLDLTDAEATKFWPVYDRYSADLAKLGDQRYSLIKDYANGFGTLTDARARNLITRSLPWMNRLRSCVASTFQ
jgi:hypothetical protein